MGGVIPKIMVVGLQTGEAGCEMSPCRRCRTADKRGEYHVDEVEANVEKSRI
jgi:hypothetical protein